MIMPEGLPEFKRFAKTIAPDPKVRGYVMRFVAAFLLHAGRMSASQVGQVLRSNPRHRGSVTRFLTDWDAAHATGSLRTAQSMLLGMERKRGKWLFLLDQTYCGQQGKRTENTFSTAHRGRRQKHAPKDQRKKKKQQAQRSCHCFVCGLLITPSGYRVPLYRSYCTESYCAKQGREYRKQTELAGDLIRSLPVPEGVPVVVLGDTAFDARPVHAACDQRGFTYVVSMNPERVLETAKPRGKVSSLVKGFLPNQFAPIKLVPGQGAYVAQRRVARCRLGRKVKSRTFYVHAEKINVHSLGEVRVIFSTTTSPKRTNSVEVKKTLLTNDLSLSVAEVVELYDLRWQIELFFKELKSTLGFHQYRFRKFTCVERWVEMCLLTFLYLEWYRAQRRKRRGQPAKENRWWLAQRAHGVAMAVRQAVDRHDLSTIARLTETKAGQCKLRRILYQALPLEFRMPP